MKKTSNRKPSTIVRLTRSSMECKIVGRGSKSKTEFNRWVFYGVDCEGIESVYADLKSEKEYEAWRQTDPLWHEAQEAIFRHLLEDPGTRDLLIQLNLKAALDKGDKETAAALFRLLSPERKLKLLTPVAKNGNKPPPEQKPSASEA